LNFIPFYSHICEKNVLSHITQQWIVDFNFANFDWWQFFKVNPYWPHVSRNWLLCLNSVKTGLCNLIKHSKDMIVNGIKSLKWLVRLSNQCEKVHEAFYAEKFN